MNPNDLHQLWNDALDDVPTEAVSGPTWKHLQQGLRAERRRRVLTRTAAIAAVALGAVGVWQYLSPSSVELAKNSTPQPGIQAPAEPPEASPAPPEAATSPSAGQIVIAPLPLKEFLAQLPHHGIVEVKNERGRFLFVVDNETGEMVTAVLSPDDKL